MDWQEIIIKVIIGGVAGMAAKLATTQSVFDWNTLVAVAGGGFVLGALNVISQIFSTSVAAPSPTAKVGFWKKFKKSF